MTPIVFHQASFTATQVGQGLAASALIGTAARLLSGVLLDRGLSCSWPVRAAAEATLVVWQNFHGVRRASARAKSRARQQLQAPQKCAASSPRS